MLIKPFLAYIPKQEAIDDVNTFIDEVKEDFSSQLVNGRYKTVETPYIYIYEIHNKLGTSRGIVALSDSSDILSGKILKHEHIIPYKTSFLKEFILKESAMLKPIMAIVNSPSLLKSIVDDYLASAKPTFSCRLSNDEKHTLYQINEHSVQNKIISQMANIPTAYIADGHHRYETYIELLKEGKSAQSKGVLTAFFSKEDMHILAYHRGVRLQEDFDYKKFFTLIEQIADIKAVFASKLPLEKYSCIINLAGKSYLLTFKQEVVERYTKDNNIALDIEIIEKEVFQAILNISTSYHHIDNLVGSLSGEELFNMANDFYMTIGLFPVGIEDMITKANRGEVLPAKSTWFEPKIRSGVVVARW